MDREKARMGDRQKREMERKLNEKVRAEKSDWFLALVVKNRDRLEEPEAWG